MITRLKIANFKSHANTDLKFNYLTVLTGINGCGKTSLLQALLLLRQSYSKGRLQDGLDLNSPLVDIGVGDDALYKAAKNPIITFDIVEDNIDMHFSFNVEKSLTSSFIEKEEYSDNINSKALQNLSLFNNNFQYISALRWGGRSNFPKDTYLAETQSQISDVKGQCELLGNFLYKHGAEPTYNYTKCDGSELSLLDQTITWEQAISRGLTIQVEQSADNTSYNVRYGYELADSDEKPVNGLRAENIGFGISYSLPVIAALLYAKPNTLVIIENPEAHLHPDGQATMAQLISLVAGRGIQVIVETHSDHIINGILKGCKHYAEGLKGISKDKVSMYYLGGHDKHYASLVESIKIRDNGQIEYQPKGFFDRIEMDLMDLSE